MKIRSFQYVNIIEKRQDETRGTSTVPVQDQVQDQAPEATKTSSKSKTKSKTDSVAAPTQLVPDTQQPVPDTQQQPIPDPTQQQPVPDASQQQPVPDASQQQPIPNPTQQQPVPVSTDTVKPPESSPTVQPNSGLFPNFNSTGYNSTIDDASYVDPVESLSSIQLKANKGFYTVFFIILGAFILFVASFILVLQRINKKKHEENVTDRKRQSIYQQNLSKGIGTSSTTNLARLSRINYDNSPVLPPEVISDLSFTNNNGNDNNDGNGHNPRSSYYSVSNHPYRQSVQSVDASFYSNTYQTNPTNVATIVSSPNSTQVNTRSIHMNNRLSFPVSSTLVSPTNNYPAGNPFNIPSPTAAATVESMTNSPPLVPPQDSELDDSQDNLTKRVSSTRLSTRPSRSSSIQPIPSPRPSRTSSLRLSPNLDQTTYPSPKQSKTSSPNSEQPILSPRPSRSSSIHHSPSSDKSFSSSRPSRMSSIQQNSSSEQSMSSPKFSQGHSPLAPVFEQDKEEGEDDYTSSDSDTSTSSEEDNDSNTSNDSDTEDDHDHGHGHDRDDDSLDENSTSFNETTQDISTSQDVGYSQSYSRDIGYNRASLTIDSQLRSKQDQDQPNVDITDRPLLSPRSDSLYSAQYTSSANNTKRGDSLILNRGLLSPKREDSFLANQSINSIKESILSRDQSFDQDNDTSNILRSVTPILPEIVENSIVNIIPMVPEIVAVSSSDDSNSHPSHSLTVTSESSTQALVITKERRNSLPPFPKKEDSRNGIFDDNVRRSVSLQQNNNFGLINQSNSVSTNDSLGSKGKDQIEKIDSMVSTVNVNSREPEGKSL